jgi:hypothetical protein
MSLSPNGEVIFEQSLRGLYERVGAREAHGCNRGGVLNPRAPVVSLLILIPLTHTLGIQPWAGNGVKFIFFVRSFIVIGELKWMYFLRS